MLNVAEETKNTLTGPFLRFIRKRKGLTQERVCEGICSVTYLSKIETGRVIPNEEIFVLLRERLEIDPRMEDYYDIKQIQKEIKNCHIAINNRQKEKAINIFNELKNKEEFLLHDPQLFRSYQLLSYLFHLTVSKLDEAAEVKKELYYIRGQFNREEQAAFAYFNGIHQCLLCRYGEGLHYFHEAEHLLHELQQKDRQLYYHLALTYSHIQNTSMALYYATMALKLYEESANYLMSIDCRMILGLNYARSQNFSGAEKEYRNILELTISLGLNKHTANVYHNLGHLYKNMNVKDKAIENFLESLAYRETSDTYFQEANLELTDLYIQSGEYVLASSQLNQLSALKELPTKTQYEIQLKRLKLNTYMDRSSTYHQTQYVDFLENTYIPFLEKTKDTSDIHIQYENLGKHYFYARKYKSASQYFQLALRTIK